MKKLKIKFVDFWDNFDVKNNDFYKILNERYEIEFSDNPDILFFSCFGSENLKYKCIKVFYTGENIVPDFNNCDYAIGFNYIEFGDRYVRIPLYSLFNYKNSLLEALNIHRKSIAEKNKFCNFIYSNSEADQTRSEFFYLLSKYKKIDSGGRYLNNIGEFVKDKIEFQRQYKFSIAFENSSEEGYTTEKLIEAKAAGTIPIYWGNPSIGKEFNTKSFINCHDYETFNDVIELIKKIDADKELFVKYMEEPFCLNNFDISKYYNDKLCDFLVKIVELNKKKLCYSHFRNWYLFNLNLLSVINRKNFFSKHLRSILKRLI